VSLLSTPQRLTKYFIKYRNEFLSHLRFYSQKKTFFRFNCSRCVLSGNMNFSWSFACRFCCRHFHRPCDELRSTAVFTSELLLNWILWLFAWNYHNLDISRALSIYELNDAYTKIFFRLQLEIFGTIRAFILRLDGGLLSSIEMFMRKITIIVSSCNASSCFDVRFQFTFTSTSKDFPISQRYGSRTFHFLLFFDIQNTGIMLYFFWLFFLLHE
jgi:hypothetical protein